MSGQDGIGVTDHGHHAGIEWSPGEGGAEPREYLGTPGQGIVREYLATPVLSKQAAGWALRRRSSRARRGWKLQFQTLEPGGGGPQARCGQEGVPPAKGTVGGPEGAPLVRQQQPPKSWRAQGNQGGPVQEGGKTGVAILGPGIAKFGEKSQVSRGNSEEPMELCPEAAVLECVPAIWSKQQQEMSRNSSSLRELQSEAEVLEAAPTIRGMKWQGQGQQLGRKDPQLGGEVSADQEVTGRQIDTQQQHWNCETDGGSIPDRNSPDAILDFSADAEPVGQNPRGRAAQQRSEHSGPELGRCLKGADGDLCSSERATSSTGANN